MDEESSNLLSSEKTERGSIPGADGSRAHEPLDNDMHAAGRLWGRRARYSYAWRSLLNAGALVAFGSDAPVETPNPLAVMSPTLTRRPFKVVSRHRT